MLLNVTQISEKLGISQERVALLCRTGALPAQFNPEGSKRYYRVDEKAVAAYKKRMQALPPADDTPPPAASAPAKPTPATEQPEVPDGFVDMRTAMALVGTRSTGTLYRRVHAGTIQVKKMFGRTFFRQKDCRPSTRLRLNGAPAPGLPLGPPVENTPSRLDAVEARLGGLGVVEARVGALETRLARLIASLGGGVNYLGPGIRLTR